MGRLTIVQLINLGQDKPPASALDAPSLDTFEMYQKYMEMHHQEAESWDFDVLAARAELRGDADFQRVTE